MASSTAGSTRARFQEGLIAGSDAVKPPAFDRRASLDRPAHRVDALDLGRDRGRQVSEQCVFVACRIVTDAVDAVAIRQRRWPSRGS